MRRKASAFARRVCIVALLSISLCLASPCLADEGNSARVAAEEVLAGLRTFYAKTARPDGSFQPGIDPEYVGMSDSAYSDLAAVTYACTVHKTFGWQLPHEAKTIEFLHGRQKETGDFVNLGGTVDPASPQGRVYNTTQALVALRSLGKHPRYDPLPVFEEILKQDYKTLPAYSTSFFPLAYLCYGKPIPQQADRAIRALMIQDEDGYLNNHIAATFHASHYYALVGDPTPNAAQMIDRILRDQKADGSWLLNLPARDRHATFDAVFTLLHEGHDREDCRAAIERAARWALSCRNADGGFGHYPGSTSDADAVYFQVGTLVMAGFLEPAKPLPDHPELLSWGHLMPVRRRPPPAEQIILPHGGWVGGVALNSDGRRLATACSDHRAYLWDARSGRLQATFKGHSDCVVSVAFSPDGERLVTGSYDQTAKVWDVASREVRHTLSGHRGAVTSVAFAPNSSALATGGIDGRVMIWDTETAKRRHTLDGHKSWVNSVAFSPDGELVVSGSSDGTVKVWSASSGELRKTLPASTAEVRSIAISADGKWIAAGIRYGKIKLWNTDGWKESHTLALQADDVNSLAFTPDSQRLLAATGEWNRPGRIDVWDVASSKKIDELKHTGEVLAVAVSRDGQTIAAGGGDRTASVWVQRSRAEMRFKHHFGDRDLQGRNMGQTALADLDRDGDLDFITGEQNGRIFWYEYRSADDWIRHDLGANSPSDVGGEAFDVNDDGWIDFIAGGAWYENPKMPREKSFQRRVFDPQLNAVHDLILGDLDGDKRPDVLTMSDRNDLRWYTIPKDPKGRWPATTIGEPVHSGISLGDLDADGDLDVVRSNVWFENQAAGKRWTMHKMTEPWGASDPPFAVNATQTKTVDLNRDGRLDVVICDGENPKSKIAWLEAPADPRGGQWQTHPLPRGDDAARGALHSLQLADFDNDGDIDIFTVEMERFPGDRPPRWFIWENVDGKGKLAERVILDANLGGHEAVAGDVDGDGDIDICAKPWTPNKSNALGGKSHFSYLENVTVKR